MTLAVLNFDTAWLEMLARIGTVPIWLTSDIRIGQDGGYTGTL